MIVRNKAKEFKYTHNFVEALFAENLHAKRVYSLANATLGTIAAFPSQKPSEGRLRIILLSQMSIWRITAPVAARTDKVYRSAEAAQSPNN
jgi:hypothetical protein